MVSAEEGFSAADLLARSSHLLRQRAASVWPARRICLARTSHHKNSATDCIFWQTCFLAARAFPSWYFNGFPRGPAPIVEQPRRNHDRQRARSFPAVRARRGAGGGDRILGVRRQPQGGRRRHAHQGLRRARGRRRKHRPCPARPCGDPFAALAGGRSRLLRRPSWR